MLLHALQASHPDFADRRVDLLPSKGGWIWPYILAGGVPSKVPRRDAGSFVFVDHTLILKDNVPHLQHLILEA